MKKIVITARLLEQIYRFTSEQKHNEMSLEFISLGQTLFPANEHLVELSNSLIKKILSPINVNIRLIGEVESLIENREESKSEITWLIYKERLGKIQGLSSRDRFRRLAEASYFIPSISTITGVLPDSLPFYNYDRSEEKFNADIHHRTLVWLGEENFQRIKSCSLGCVGIGGLTNLFCIFAAHHGFERFVLIDDDKLEQSNLNRWVGAVKSDIGRSKVQIVKDTLQQINPDVRVKVYDQKFLLSENVDSDLIQQLAQTDIIVCGVDNDYSRYHTQLFALAFSKPLFDMGCGIYLKNSATLEPTVDEAGGQIRVYIPGEACLGCMGLETAGLADLDHRELDIQRGYLVGTDITPPSAITLNATIASICLSMIVDYITGSGVIPRHLKFDRLGYRLQRIQTARNPNCPICRESAS